MKNGIFFICFLSITLTTRAQVYNPFFGSIVANSSPDTILAYLNEFQSLGIKEIGTTELDNATSWILGKYAQYGYSDVTIDPFSYFGFTTSNIIVKKQGCLYPDTYLIVDGHYDTRNGPGTNDNGSGTAIILEMARLLKDIETEYSILFIHFSGEEDGLKGSNHYVNNTVIPQSMDIRLVFNIDEVGGISGMTNNTIVCEQDEGFPPANNAASSIATAELANCVGLYSNLNTQISYAYASDYMPFEENGEIITGFYEANESPYAHTINDNLGNMDPGYVFEVGKAAIGATLHFSHGFDHTSEITVNECGNYTSPSGNYLWSNSGIYYDTIQTVAGCDSIIEINLTIVGDDNPTSLFTTVCESYLSPSGNYIWTVSGLYYDTLQNLAGCDSLLEINLTINNIDVTTNLSNETITANNLGADSYQWVDCGSNFSFISGETTSSYTATITGSYAVIISENGCSDTSDCLVVDFNELSEMNGHLIHLYPNPNDGNFTIEFDENIVFEQINFYNSVGKLIHKEITSNQGVIQFHIEFLSDGFYFLEIPVDEMTTIRKRILITTR